MPYRRLGPRQPLPELGNRSIRSCARKTGPGTHTTLPRYFNVVCRTFPDVLALLGLLLSFTLAMSVERFDTRIKPVQDEVNALGTTFLRTMLISGSDGERLRELLTQYIDSRLDDIAANMNGRSAKPLVRRMEKCSAKFGPKLPHLASLIYAR